MEKETADFIEKGSEAWNIAQGYTFMKILKPLVEIDRLINIARYGTDTIESSIEVPHEVKTNLRIEAINRYLDELKKIIDNSKFTMNKGLTEEIDKLDKRLEMIEDTIAAISSLKVDARSGMEITYINEQHFNLTMNALRDTKNKLYDLVNKASLIFPASDEIDLEKLKHRFTFGG